MQVEVRNRPQFMGTDPFTYINFIMEPLSSSYTMISAVSEDGEVNNPKMNYQSGAPVCGYMYDGDSARMEELASKYVTYMSKMINKSSSFAENINAIYFAPALVAVNRSPVPLVFPVITNIIGTIIHPFAIENIKHAKVLDYFRIRVVGNSGENIMTFAEYGDSFNVDVMMTGSDKGKATLLFKDKNNEYNGVKINSNRWPSVNISGALERFEFNLSFPGGNTPTGGNNTPIIPRYLSGGE